MATNQAFEHTLQQTGQAIIDFAPFDPEPLRAAVDEHLGSYRENSPGGKSWQAIRILRQPVAGAFSHMICTAAIVDMAEIPETDPSASRFEAAAQFEESAAGVYEAPSTVVADLIADRNSPLFAAGKFLVQADRTAARIEAEPGFDPFREAGRLWTVIGGEDSVNLSPDYISSSLEVNARGNVKEILVLRALAHNYR